MVRLGAQLFFDPRLSLDGTRSCASCHDPAKAWANHDRTDTGVLGRVGGRNSGTVLDAARMEHQFWDGRAASLEDQAWGPILNPLEMGETVPGVLAKLEAIPGYRTQFRALFRRGVTQAGVARALAAFERTVVSGPSPFDRFRRGERGAMSEAARRGLELFDGKARCFRCHNGAKLSNQGFANLGVGMTDPRPDLGREAVTGDPEDRGRFKTPGLRNVALTWPYFHDGSAPTLEAVIDLYDQGGVPNPNLDPRIRPLGLTPEEKRELRAFLEALTGTPHEVRKPDLPR
jgi:cytochrome c peroxidase